MSKNLIRLHALLSFYRALDNPSDVHTPMIKELEEMLAIEIKLSRKPE